MAWFCSGTTNTELIQNLWDAGLIKNARVKEAMLGVSIHQNYYLLAISLLNIAYCPLFPFLMLTVVNLSS